MPHVEELQGNTFSKLRLQPVPNITMQHDVNRSYTVRTRVVFNVCQRMPCSQCRSCVTWLQPIVLDILSATHVLRQIQFTE